MKMGREILLFVFQLQGIFAGNFSNPNLDGDERGVRYNNVSFSYTLFARLFDVMNNAHFCYYFLFRYIFVNDLPERFWKPSIVV